MEIPAKYNPAETEDKWYSYWMKNRFFRSVPDERKPYTIVIPPPNVTGVLHMGHMLNNTIQDILVRRARMKGFNACWVPGTDHASIATEAKVVSKLRAEGIDKASLTRDEFLHHAWEWKEKHGGIILEQLKKLGASCDWDRTSFTMDEALSESVVKVFVDLFQKGNIYRGVRMVNWDPQAKTAVSDEEVIYKELQSKLYYLKYKVVEADNEWVTIATTRPETILGDTAVCVHPEDERYFALKGKHVYVPLINRAIPIIEDEYVDREFGTGCLKITPAHDINDYEIGIKHNLPSIDIFNDDGTMSQAAGLYLGIDRFEVRDIIIPELKNAGNLDKIEDYTNKVGYSERTDAVIEPKLSMQWFLRMKDISQPALENVLNDQIALHPPKFKNTYRHWMENVKDWCISRQLWWGHRIPAWYLPNSNEFVVAEHEEEALQLAREKTGLANLSLADLRQDEDVLDTWFSSWLWPISVFDGIRNPENADFKYYYPTNDLVTAPEILFFWVARMIIAGYEYAGDLPFRNVYLTGIVRDDKRRKMSKSLGNSPDPIELMKIYSADGVRVGMLLCSPAGGDLLYDNSLPEQGRNFGNKIWNAFRLVNGWEISNDIPQPESSRQAIDWFTNRLDQVIAQIDEHFDKFRLSDALMTVYKLFWDDFSAWYLEAIKPGYQEPIDALTIQQTHAFFDKLLHVLHPFMPFITEEIWQLMAEHKEGESLMISPLPEANKYDSQAIADFERTIEITSFIRKIRAEKNLPAKEELKLFVQHSSDYSARYEALLMKLAKLSSTEPLVEKPDGSVSFVIGTTEFAIPLEGFVNVEEELATMREKLIYELGFLDKVMVKLNNASFVDNAPDAVVQIERNKKADAESRIKTLSDNISNLEKMR
ncbi:MAG: valine--tRNA ligase [Bacteroidales bacterium]|nr:valine--tRNA ligase [Bacteroidales bacterium]